MAQSQLRHYRRHGPGSKVGLGEHVTWTAPHCGLRFTTTREIVGRERPARFVDRRVRGPFHTFRHEHRFEPAGSGCLMVDHVRFTAPFGPVGVVAERLVLGRDLRRLIEQRNDYLRAALE